MLCLKPKHKRSGLRRCVFTQALIGSNSSASHEVLEVSYYYNNKTSKQTKHKKTEKQWLNVSLKKSFFTLVQRECTEIKTSSHPLKQNDKLTKSETNSTVLSTFYVHGRKRTSQTCYTTEQCNTTLLPRVNTIVIGWFCGAKYTYHIHANHKR